MKILTSGLPVGEPVVDEDSRPFWEGAAEGRLVLPRCRRCQTVIWYPRHLCVNCGSREVDWFEASGSGSVYSFTVVRNGEGAFSTTTPFVVAYVELEEGPRVLTNLIGEPAGWSVGQPVSAVFDRSTEGGQPLLRFEAAQ